MKVTITTLFCSFCFFLTFGQVSFTNQSPLLFHKTVHSGAPIAVADINGDGLDDIIRLDSTKILLIDYQSVDGSTFSGRSIEKMNGFQWAICIADVDHDGYNDIFTGGAYNGLKLFKSENGGNSFNKNLLPNDNIYLQTSNFVDIDNDGFIDIFACNDDGVSSPYRNDSLGNFSLDYNLIFATSTVPSDNSGNYGSVWTDYDNDGDLDLYITKCRAGVSNPDDGRRLNLLFQKTESGEFSEVAAQAGLQPKGQSWAADFADIDNDGDLDCFVINHDKQSNLYENQGDGSFKDISSFSGMAITLDAAGPGIQAIFRDFDNDGFVDLLYTSQGLDHGFFHNDGDNTFTSMPSAIPTLGKRIHTAAAGDLNNDGFVDLITGFGNGYNGVGITADRLYLNNGNSNNFLKVALKGVISNINGIGARIEIFGDWGMQIREIRSGESYGINHSLDAHFGLGTAQSVDSMIVKWPSGIVDKFIQPNINQTHQITEGNGCSNSVVNFTYSRTGLSFEFQGSILGSGSDWSWDFGDGDTSSLQNPNHTYINPGIYEVCVQVNSLCGPQQYCQQVEALCSPPTAQFSYRANELVVHFQNESLPLGQNWLWDFGDNTISEEQDPEHTFSVPGTYTVCLQGNSLCGEVEICQEITVNCSSPQANFTYTTNGLTINLQDLSSSDTEEWFWDFGDGETASQRETSHQYSAPGSYTVCLIASSLCGIGEYCETINVSCTLPDASFTVIIDDLVATFLTDSSSLATYHWDFGDGDTSTIQNPTHLYKIPGTYTSCLTKQDVCGSSEVCKQITLSCLAPLSDFSYSITELTVSFNQGNPDTSMVYFWDFGDSTTSIAPNPEHVYPAPGIYQACLISTNTCGQDTLCLQLDVSCSAPPANFIFEANGLSFEFQSDTSAMSEYWLWRFGDGNTSSLANPEHLFELPGQYEVCLEVGDICGTNQFCEIVNASCAIPEAAFSANAIDSTVFFFDASLNGPSSWLWDFGDGNSSEEQNPTHAYSSTGSFQVCLYTSNGCGRDSICQTVVIILSNTEDFALNEAITLFPNPVKSNLNIQIRSSKKEAFKASIINSLGEIIFQDIWPLERKESLKQINTTLWPKGIYSFHLESPSGLYVKKFVIQ